MVRQMIVPYLISGAPHHIELRSQAFDDPSQKHEHTAKLFSNCFLSAPVHAFVCDSSGNKTPLRTTLNLSWTPSSCGLLLTKRAQKGEAVFEANTMKCGSRSGDQMVKLRVFSPDHKNLTVSVFAELRFYNLCRPECFASVCFLFRFCGLMYSSCPATISFPAICGANFLTIVFLC